MVNAFDAVLAVVLVLAAMRGYRRGALSWLGSMGGALGGLLLGARFAPDLAAAVIGEPGLGLALLTLGGLLLSLFLGQALGLALGHRLRSAVAGAGAAPADRVAGVAVACVWVLAMLWLLGGMLAQGPWPALTQQLRESRIASGIDQSLPPPPDVFGRASAYLDEHGFPQVFADLGGPVAPPAEPPEEGAVAAAAEAGTPSLVRVETAGCGGAALGSGFATTEGFVITNAHVVAGADAITVRDQSGGHDATAVHVDTDQDLAVLRVPELTATPIGWVDEPAQRTAAGATLGFPGQASTLEVRGASVLDRGMATGRDIYGDDRVTREILTVSSGVERGDSGGPFVTSDGQVGGVVFAASRSAPGSGYALTAESVRDDVAAAVARDEAADTGPCRF